MRGCASVAAITSVVAISGVAAVIVGVIIVVRVPSGKFRMIAVKLVIIHKAGCLRRSNFFTPFGGKGIINVIKTVFDIVKHVFNNGIIRTLSTF